MSNIINDENLDQFSVNTDQLSDLLCDKDGANDLGGTFNKNIDLIDQIYFGNDFNSMQGFSDTLLVVDHAIAVIVQKCDEFMYIQQVMTKVPQFSANKTLMLFERVSELEFLPQDDIQVMNSNEPNPLLSCEDFECRPPEKDQWRRSGANVQIKQKFEVPPSLSRSSKTDIRSIKRQSSIKIDLMSSSKNIFSGIRRQSSQKHLDLSPIKRGTIFQQQNIICLEKPEEPDIYTMSLRVLKENEIKNREEQMRQEEERMIRLKNQQEELRRAYGQYQGGNSVQFTYDYDGQIIIQQHIDVNELGGAQKQGVLYNFSTLASAKDNRNNSTIGSKGNLPTSNSSNNLPSPDSQFQGLRAMISKKSLQTSQQTEQQNFMKSKNQLLEGKPLDKIKLSKGVTLIENGVRAVQGPQYDIKITQSFFNRQPNLGHSKKIQMTKKQYYSFITGKTKEEQEQQEQQELERQRMEQQKLDKEQEEMEKQQTRQQKIEELKKLLDGSARRQQQLSLENSSLLDGGSITVMNRDQMIDSIEYSQEESESLYYGLNKSTKSVPVFKNPIDEYNMAIYNQSPDYSQQMNSKLTLPPIFSPKPKQFATQVSLGNLNKFPRERANQYAKKYLQNYSKLAQPSIGKTLGHGINSGINPEEHVSLDNILDQINNVTGTPHSISRYSHSILN